MRKTLLPLAAVLGWSVALAALSSFDAMDAERDAAEKIEVMVDPNAEKDGGLDE